MTTSTVPESAVLGGDASRPAGKQDVRSELRALLEARMPGVTFADDEDIFSLGIVNSLFAMELVLFIEKNAGSRVPNEELTMDHFRSIDAMTTLAARISGGPDEGGER